MGEKCKTSDPLWTVRGVNRGEDICLVIEAPDDVAADCFATKRGVDVVVVTRATQEEVATARTANRLWRYTPEPKMKCFGRPVGQLQAAMLLLCGLATVLINLRAFHVPLKWH